MSTFEVSSILCPDCEVPLLIEECQLRCRVCGRTFSYPRELDPPRLLPEENAE